MCKITHESVFEQPSETHRNAKSQGTRQVSSVTAALAPSQHVQHMLKHALTACLTLSPSSTLMNTFPTSGQANPLLILLEYYQEFQTHGIIFTAQHLPFLPFFFFTNKVGEEEAITTYRRRGIPVSIISVMRD